MDHSSSRRLLDILIENSARILRAGFGVNRAESTFFDVVDLLKENSSLKSYFLELVDYTFAKKDSGALDAGMVPRELIELVAHEVRWKEFLDLAESRIRKVFHGDGSLAVGDVAHGVIDAYKNDWRDREFYKRYGGDVSG